MCAWSSVYNSIMWFTLLVAMEVNLKLLPAIRFCSVFSQWDFQIFGASSVSCGYFTLEVINWTNVRWMGQCFWLISIVFLLLNYTSPLRRVCIERTSKSQAKLSTPHGTCVAHIHSVTCDLLKTSLAFYIPS